MKSNLWCSETQAYMFENVCMIFSSLDDFPRDINALAIYVPCICPLRKPSMFACKFWPIFTISKFHNFHIIWGSIVEILISVSVQKFPSFLLVQGNQKSVALWVL